MSSITADAAVQPLRRPGLGALSVLLTAVFMASLDFFIVNVAIPSIQQDLGAGAAGIQWVVAGYGLAYGVGLITGGRIGDLWGRRSAFIAGLAGFTFTSALCGIAPTADALIAARILQGCSAALMAPQVLGIVGTVFSGEEKARAFGAYATVLGLGAVLGQLFGGLLIHLDPAGLGWRACFLLNVPIGLAALAAAPILVPQSEPSGKDRIDVAGVGLISLALLATVLPLIEGREHGWPLWTWLSFGAAAALFTLFVIVERHKAAHGADPLIPPALFHQPAFSVGMVVQTVFWMGQASFFLVLALYLQDGLGESPLQAGLIFLPLGIGFMAASLNARRLAARLDRQVIALGAVVMIVGQIALEVLVELVRHGSPAVLLTPGLLIVSIGMGLVVAPLAVTVLSRIPPASAGTAAGVLSTGQQIGNAIGVALVGVVFYGVLGNGGDYDRAFRVALLFSIGVAVLVAVAIQFLPRRDRA